MSAFAQRIQKQLEIATDPAAVKRNEISARELTTCVERLKHRQTRLRQELALSCTANDELTAERIELIRIERQLEMVDRLLTRYEQNAPVASTAN